MSDIESGERRRVGEQTQISLKVAVIIVACGVIPLTLFVMGLFFGQKETNVKIDNLIATMEIRRAASDKQFDELSHRVDDHETRIRNIENRRNP